MAHAGSMKCWPRARQWGHCSMNAYIEDLTGIWLLTDACIDIELSARRVEAGQALWCCLVHCFGR